MNQFFPAWCDVRHDQILHFDASLNDLDLYSRSPVYVNAKTFANYQPIVKWHGAQTFTVYHIRKIGDCKEVL